MVARHTRHALTIHCCAFLPQAGGHKNNNKVNKLLGAAWKAMSEAEREPYQRYAAQDRIRFLAVSQLAASYDQWPRGLLTHHKHCAWCLPRLVVLQEMSKYKPSEGFAKATTR